MSTTASSNVVPTRPTITAWPADPTSIRDNNTLIARQTAPVTTLRHPYLDYYDANSKSLTRYLNDLRVLSVQSTGTQDTTWAAVETDPHDNKTTTMYVTDHGFEIMWSHCFEADYG